MAVSFGTGGTGGFSGSTNSPFTPANFSIGTLTNGALVIWVFLGSGTAPATISCTWNGVSMFQITSTAGADANTGYITMFGLINPANGSNSASCTFTGFSGVSAEMGFFSFSGADQSANSTTFINGTHFTSSSQNTTFTNSVTTVNGNATCYAWATAGTLTAASCTPALDFHVNQVGTVGVDGGGHHTLSTTTSDSYTMVQSPTDFASADGCSIKASAAAAAQVPYQPYFQQFLASKRKSVGWSPLTDPRRKVWRPERQIILPKRRAA